MFNARLAVTLATSSLLVGSLTGCVISDRSLYASVPSSTSMARPSVSPSAAPVYGSAQTFDYTGSSVFDAQHAVERYISRSYSNAKLVAIHGQTVGTNARIAATSNWEFTYRVAVAGAPEPAVSPTPIPTPSSTPSLAVMSLSPQTTYKLVRITYTGNGLLLAPEEELDNSSSLAAIDSTRIILLDKAINTARDIGMGVGSPGIEVTLRTTVNGGAVYEIDSSVATRQVMSSKVVVDNRSYTYVNGPNYNPGYDYEYVYDYAYDYGYDYHYGSGSQTKDVGGYDTWAYVPVSGTTTVDPYYGGSGSGRTYATPAPSYTSGPATQAKTAFVRGKYLIDAYNGAIIDRPNTL